MDGQVHKTKVAFDCISLTSFLIWQCLNDEALSKFCLKKCWNQRAMSATNIARGGLARVSDVLGP